MDLTGYNLLGFESNPFNSNTAEREPEIAEYAVHPPYLDRTQEASKAAKGAFFLEGARGSGKSATRLTIAKKMFTGQGAPLVVPLTVYNVFRPYVKGQLTPDLLVTQIAFLTAEALVAWLASADDAEKAEVTKKIAKQEKLVSRFISQFYLNRADNSRSASASETYELLRTSRQGQARILVERKWDQFAGTVASLASSLGKKYLDLDIGDPASLQKLLEQQRGDGFIDYTYTLTRMVEVAKAFGFSGVLIQIDKLDETDWTASEPSAAGELVLPLLANISLHEIDGLVWTFFVWDEVAGFLRKNHRDKIRFDKISHGKIEWETKYLSDLVSRRLSFFSNGKVHDLEEICDAGTNPTGILPDLIELTGHSPRGLISALDHVLSTHIQRNQSAPKKLDPSSFELGMNSYAIRSLEEAGLLDEARTIAKLNLASFVTKDVQNLTRQSAQTARGRIDQWLSDRLVKQDGTRSTGGAGRPVDQFRVSDPRAARVMSRGL